VLNEVVDTATTRLDESQDAEEEPSKNKEASGDEGGSGGGYWGGGHVGPLRPRDALRRRTCHVSFALQKRHFRAQVSSFCTNRSE